MSHAYMQMCRDLLLNCYLDPHVPVSTPAKSKMEALLPTGSEEREVLGIGSIPVAILPSCHDMRMITLQLHNMNIDG